MRYLVFLLLLATIPASAQQTIPQLKTSLQNEPDSLRIGHYLELGQLYAQAQPDSAVDFCAIGMRLAEKKNDHHSQALLLLQLGKINSLHHNTELARKFENDALIIFRNLHDKDGVADSYDELGLLDGEQRNIISATRDLDQAMKFYRDARDTANIIATYHSLGTVYEEKGEKEKAMTYYLRALIQYEHRKQKPTDYFILLEKIGQLYLQKGDSHTALRYLEEGLHNSNKPTLRDTEITLLDDEGKIFETSGERSRALHYYKEELEAAKAFNRPAQQAQALINIAGVLKNENAVQSLTDLKSALKISLKIHDPQLEANIYGAMAATYRQARDYKEAMAALEENHRLLDSLLDANTEKDIAALDSSYKLESSINQIGHLQQVNRSEKIKLDTSYVLLLIIVVTLILLWLYLRKINRLNNALKASNQVRDTLFSIIGHDLKGPVGNAAQMAEMMNTESFTETEIRSMIAELGKQTAMAFELLNALFEWGSAQLKGVKVNPETISAQTLIQKNMALLGQQAAGKNITVSDHTAAGLKLFADPNHFDFILRNLLSNAIKFTFRDGHIDVAAEENNDTGEIILSIKDTGKGISAEQQAAFLKTNLQVSFGTGGEKGSGLGLLLIKEFVQANKGRVWLESKENEGTTFYVALPASEK